MRRIYALLDRASASSVAVLLLGESGTGKEVCARAIHDASPRRKGPFVVFDCGAASETLVESDLFGHTRGAFTGADRERAGAFALAHGGTLFLDEVGDLPLRLQPKLLRLLESGTVQPVGGAGHQAYDVRIVAATHHDLRADITRGTFRGDVYYRLAVVEVHLPALRERLDDVAELTQLFLEREGVAVPSVASLASTNLDRLRSYAWPGNVRELRNTVARAAALAPKGATFAEMPVLIGSAPTSRREPEARIDRHFSEAKAEIVDQFERAYVRSLLALHGDNLAEAARVAGVERKHLYRLMARLGLTPEEP
jgi:DNA-binding NtrC family response regulator